MVVASISMANLWDVKRVLDNLPEEVLEMPVQGYENIRTLLSNIEIASDLTDEESNNWKLKNEMAKGGSILSSKYSIGGL